MKNLSAKSIQQIRKVLDSNDWGYKVYRNEVGDVNGFRLLDDLYTEDLLDGDYLVRLNNFSNKFVAGNVYKVIECLRNDDEVVEEIFVQCMKTGEKMTGSVDKFIPIELFKETKCHYPEWF